MFRKLICLLLGHKSEIYYIYKITAYNSIGEVVKTSKPKHIKPRCSRCGETL